VYEQILFLTFSLIRFANCDTESPAYADHEVDAYSGWFDTDAACSGGEEASSSLCGGAQPMKYDGSF
jgi:hypothetical protein